MDMDSIHSQLHDLAAHVLRVTELGKEQAAIIVELVKRMEALELQVEDLKEQVKW